MIARPENNGVDMKHNILWTIILVTIVRTSIAVPVNQAMTNGDGNIPQASAKNNIKLHNLQTNTTNSISIKEKTLNAIGNLLTRPSQNFIPLSHSNALDNYGSFAGHYDPYNIPKADDKGDQINIEKKILFGSIEILSVKHISSSEWSENEDLDTLIGEKFDGYYTQAASALSNRFGKYRFKGSTNDYTSPFEELDKFITGDHTKLTIWKPYSVYNEYYFLVNSMSAGDGDLLFVLWLAHITPSDYQPPKKKILP